MATTLSVMPIPVVQFFADVDGSPLASGKVYTYEAGTTTPLATYNDEDGDISHANTNPVILDAFGKAVIYLGPFVYKFDVQNAAGVSQAGYPRDQIVGSLWTGALIGTSTLSPGINANGFANDITTTINKAGSGTHPVFAGLSLEIPTIGAGAATLTDATTLYIAGAPSVGSNLYAVLVAAGLARFNGSLQAPFSLSAAATALTIASNVITPTSRVHTLGAGLVKTITVPAVMAGKAGYIDLLPTAAYTTDTSSNVKLATTAVIGRTMRMVYDGSTSWWPSYVS